jgi:hypothetical protein
MMAGEAMSVVPLFGRPTDGERRRLLGREDDLQSLEELLAREIR